MRRWRRLAPEFGDECAPGLSVATAVLLAAPVASSGHELPVYPSYYPHEIEIARWRPSARAS